jgi:hypothetical protein
VPDNAPVALLKPGLQQTGAEKPVKEEAIAYMATLGNDATNKSLEGEPSEECSGRLKATVEPALSTNKVVLLEGGPAGSSSPSTGEQPEQPGSKAQFQAQADPDGSTVSELPSSKSRFTHHSLKLSHDNTLSNQNIQLCIATELVSDIKDMTFIGNGSFAAVFKGEHNQCTIFFAGPGGSCLLCRLLARR